MLYAFLSSKVRELVFWIVGWILCFVSSFENRKLLVLQMLRIPCFVPKDDKLLNSKETQIGKT